MSVMEQVHKVYNPELSNNRAKRIGDECTIHSHVWIGDDVTIGDRCKIQAFAFIPNGVKIGNDVFVGPHVCFTNDKQPPHGQFMETVVEDGATIGANATILPGVRLGRDCMVGAGAVVTKDVKPGVIVVGNPARPVATGA